MNWPIGINRGVQRKNDTITSYSPINKYSPMWAQPKEVLLNIDWVNDRIVEQIANHMKNYPLLLPIHRELFQYYKYPVIETNILE